MGLLKMVVLMTIAGLSAATPVPPCPPETPLELWVHIQPDNFPGEIAWTVNSGNAVVAEGGEFIDSRALNSTRVCLSCATHTFNITDEYNDGLSAGEGYYRLQLDGVVIRVGGNYSSFEATEMYPTSDCGSSPLPMPQDPGATPAPPCPPETPLELWVHIRPDNFPGDIAWTVNSGNAVVAEGGEFDVDPGALKSTRVCLSCATHTFNITDEWNDGLCCANGEGYYSLQLDGVVIRVGGNYSSFEATEMHQPSDCGSSPSPMPQDPPTLTTKCIPIPESTMNILRERNIIPTKCDGQ